MRLFNDYGFLNDSKVPGGVELETAKLGFTF